MPIIDPTTAIGKMRLRVGDFTDMPIMPDSVYQSALDDTGNSLVNASILVAKYILGTLTAQTHQKLGQIEVYGSDWFNNYLAFIKITILNPNLMEIAPIPYAAGTDVLPALLQFKKDWDSNYAYGTQSDQLHLTALGGLNINDGFI